MDPSQTTQQALVDALAEEFTARMRRGERPSIDEYAHRYPEAAAQLRELLPSIALLEQNKPRVQPPPIVKMPMPERLGDYKLVREVGRGGMGIVYEAIQQSLDRRVALKLLPQHAQLDARRLDRFRIEAHAAARLHHTNIVPVFGLFESEGAQFYVMQFIEGRGLDSLLVDARSKAALRETQPLRKSTLKLLPKLPATPAPGVRPVPIPIGPSAAGAAVLASADYFRQMARLIAQAAQALEYAHGQGVLHRDIKPANLLLDNRGTLWITDFGLAKLRDTGGLTVTGDLVGTLQYMAPESLHGQSGPQSDIYGLGVTLYELVTRKPCFHEASPARLLKQISESPPPRPRQHDPSIPRDLETIVLKAIAREPKDRYATAGQLADDLARFTEDRPILARRVSSFERLWRWARRNRALAASLTAAAVSLLLATIIGWWGYGSTTRALTGEENKRVEAELATRHAEANMQLSLHALEEIFAAIAPPDDRPRDILGRRHHRAPGHEPPHEPGEPRDGRPDDPDGLAGFFGPDEHRPPMRPPDDAEHRGPGSRTEEEQRRGRLLQAVLTFYDRFAAQNEADPQLQSEAAKAQCRIGEVYARLREPEKAQQAVARSTAGFASLAQRFPDEPEYQAGLLEAHRAAAMLAGDANDLVRLASAAAAVQSAGDRLVAKFARERQYVLVAATYGDIAGVFQAVGDLPAAEKFYRLAIPLAERLLGKQVGRPGGPAEDIGVLYSRLAGVQVALKRPANAAATLRQSIDRLLNERKNYERDQLLAEQYQALAELTPDPKQTADLREKARQLEGEQRPGPRKRHGPDDGPADRPPPDFFDELLPRRGLGFGGSEPPRPR